MIQNLDQDTKKAILDLLDKLSTIEYINPESIPNIDLYMDQITSFMDDQLEMSKRFEDDKLLTKTMINNCSSRASDVNGNIPKNVGHIIIQITKLIASKVLIPLFIFAPPLIYCYLYFIIKTKKCQC